jgi:hypothetical protein
VPTPPGTFEPQVATGGGPLPFSTAQTQDSIGDIRSSPKKRPREEGGTEAEACPQPEGAGLLGDSQGGKGELRKKKKRRKDKGISATM